MHQLRPHLSSPTDEHDTPAVADGALSGGVVDSEPAALPAVGGARPPPGLRLRAGRQQGEIRTGTIHT